MFRHTYANFSCDEFYNLNLNLFIRKIQWLNWYIITYKNKLNGLAKILRYYRRDKVNYNELFLFLFNFFIFNGFVGSSQVYKILVSKETVVLRRWEIETEIYFIRRVDKGRITTVKDLESWRFER